MGTASQPASLEISLLIMKATIVTTSTSKKRRWLKVFIWVFSLLVVLPVVLFCAGYVLLWGNFDFGEERLTDTTKCGDYRLHYYLTEKGNGHVDFAHKSGKVYGKFPMKPQTETRPIWDEDCKGVRLGIGDDSMRFEVPK
jgi:hypothetical protein